MTDQVKVLIAERNGVELPDREELPLTANNIFLSNLAYVSDNVDGALSEISTSVSGKVFGNNFQINESLGNTSTTSTTVYTVKNTITTPSLPVGNYLVKLDTNFTCAAANREMDIRLREGAANIIWSSKPSYIRTAGIIPVSGYSYLAAISGVKTIVLEFKASTATTVTLSNSRLTFFRVS
jgi:hypothetical protein